MSTLAKSHLTPEQYLEIERKAEFKSEYYQGEMFAMSGGTGNHTMLIDNLIVQLGQKLRGGHSRPFSNNMRVRIDATGLYTYPDVVVACGERRFLDERHDTLLNPVLIVEVLSDSTEAYDRGEKFRQYRSLESLREYVLVSQKRMQVECFRRQAGEQWLLTEASHAEDRVALESIDCELRLADVYEEIELSGETAA